MLEFTTHFTARIIYTCYRHHREMSDHLNSFDAELNHSHFFRMFALGCFDALITLPISIWSTVGNIISSDPQITGSFYQGWTLTHSDWKPVLLPMRVWSTFKWGLASAYWDEWINPFFALVFFALFGLTPNARKEYRKLFNILGRPFGVKQTEIMEDVLPEAVFKSGGGTNMTIISNIASRYVLLPLSTHKHFPTNDILQYSRGLGTRYRWRETYPNTDVIARQRLDMHVIISDRNWESIVP